MPPGKPQKPHHKPLSTSKSAMNADRRTAEGSTHLRSQSTIKRLKMYSARPVRDTKGKLLGGAFMSKDISHSTRIAPNRKWFGNTRVVGQTELNQFRQALDTAAKDPYTVVLRQAKVPMGLVQDPIKEQRMHLLDVEPFSETFSAKRRQKKPKISVFDYETLVKQTDKIQDDVCYLFIYLFIYSVIYL